MNKPTNTFSCLVFSWRCPKAAERSDRYHCHLPGDRDARVRRQAGNQRRRVQMVNQLSSVSKCDHQ